MDHLNLEIKDAKGKTVVERRLNYTKSVLEQRDTVYVALGVGDYSVSLTGGFEDYSIAHELHIGTISLAVVGDPQDERIIVHVVDNTTGAPVPQCKVVRNLRERRWGSKDDKTKTETAITDAKGIAYFKHPGNKDFSFQTFQAFRTPEDKSLEAEDWLGVDKNDPDTNFRNNYKIFTDRSIYRPGQTVHATVMAYTKNAIP